MKRKFQNRGQDRIEGYLENNRVESEAGELTMCRVKGPSVILGLGGGKGPKGISWN